MKEEAARPGRSAGRPHARIPLRRLTLPLLLLALAAPPLLANGGIVRIVREPVGPWFATVYSSPTPLRTGEVDISVMIQDSADTILDVPLLVEAIALEVAAEDGNGDGAMALPDPIRREATRAQATNKLFKASKFDIDVPGTWRFRVEIGPGGEVGEVGFEAEVVRSTLLDRPLLLAVLVILPVALIGWLLTGDEEE